MVQWSSRSLARDRRSPEGFIEPCQPALSAVVPVGPGWIHELKHDGWRILARKDGGSLHLWSRNGRNWTAAFPTIAAALAALPVHFVLSTSRPPGSIDARTATWLVSALSKLPRTAAVAMAREVALEAQHVDDNLLVFLGRGSKGRARAPSTMACRQTPDPRISYCPGQGYEWGTVSVRLGEGAEAPLDQALSSSFG
jgi:hypothetical protein